MPGAAATQCSCSDGQSTSGTYFARRRKQLRVCGAATGCGAACDYHYDAGCSACVCAQRDRLYRSGLIVPRVGGMDHGAADQFAAEDLEAFLDRLLVGAKPVKTPKGGQVNIPEAARLAFCMSEEVVRLILDGKLARKWASLSGGLRACVLFDHFICAGE